MSAKQGIYKWHRWESINMTAKCIEHRHITAKLEAYWPSCYFVLCCMQCFLIQSVLAVLHLFIIPKLLHMVVLNWSFLTGWAWYAFHAYCLCIYGWQLFSFCSSWKGHQSAHSVSFSLFLLLYVLAYCYGHCLYKFVISDYYVAIPG